MAGLTVAVPREARIASISLLEYLFILWIGLLSMISGRLMLMGGEESQPYKQFVLFWSLRLFFF